MRFKKVPIDVCEVNNVSDDCRSSMMVHSATVTCSTLRQKTGYKTLYAVHKYKISIF